MTTSFKTRAKNYTGPSPEEKLTNELIELMEKGVNPWRRDWDSTQGEGFKNPVTGNYYTSGNVALLVFYSMSRNYTSNLFLGAGQGKKKGLRIKKGSKCVYIVRPQLNSRKEQEGTKEEKIFSWTSFKHVPIFNINDFEDCTEKTTIIKENRREIKTDRKEPEKIKKVEEVIRRYHKREKLETLFSGERCFYSPIEDKVTMAEKKKFHSSTALYSTWLHELVHSSGNNKRLNRKIENHFGSSDYAKEELVAELGSFLICNRLEIGSDTQNHVAYLGNWIKCLREDPKILIKTLGKATKACNYILEE